MFRKMDDMQIEIAKLHDIKMVHIYDVAGGTKMHGEKCITGMAVYYGEDEKLNLSELDCHFLEYVNMVFKILSDEKVRERVTMDEVTRTIFDEGLKSECESGLEVFYESPSLRYPKLSHDSMLSDRFILLGEYLIAGLYKALGTEIEIHTRKAGYRGASILRGLVNRERRTFFYKVNRKSDDVYSMKISNVPKEGSVLDVEITYEFDKIILCYQSENNELFGHTEFAFLKDRVTESSSVTFNGKDVFFESDIYEESKDALTVNEKSLLLETEDNVKVWKLPWGITSVCSIDKKETDEVDTENVRMTYIYAGGRYADIKGHTTIRNKETGVQVRTEGIRLSRILLIDGSVQTTFLRCIGNATGKYKDNLEGRTFVTKINGDKKR